ncbi:hypothetical protein A3C37_00565 [Candidatus Peribacteria bacterium RIFCSPHIGHO2_02_FULL_53_20]|nr:MAG: hypothetical protein A3C37_00565 [Candidatus Peribacteria bacterium RIFCSPHIGHO2_02_FULL_53_20]OGJ70911.1 MAG: hypothetical protein A3G69_03490 [Candidatus Peribacteria bacterium RIFCSPLOWO2_12_FULL_53_10]
MTIPPVFQQFLEPWLLILADDPVLRALQGCLLFLGVIVVFLVFYATRDILLRTRSFPAMLGSIVLVAFLPIVGFFLYLLLRPARTIAQRETDRKTEEILRLLEKDRKKDPRNKTQDTK